LSQLKKQNSVAFPERSNSKIESEKAKLNSDKDGGQVDFSKLSRIE
jgi:hypothetical protein